MTDQQPPEPDGPPTQPAQGPVTPPPYVPPAAPPPYTAPPASPPAPPAPPASPPTAWPSPDAGPPTATQPAIPTAPPYAAPPYAGQPYAGQPNPGQPYAGQPGEQAPAPKRRSTGLIVAGVLVVLILLAGAIGGAVAVTRSGGELDMTVDRCEIAEDGSLTASGTVSGPSGKGVEVEVEFVDSATGDVVDDADTSIDLGAASGGDAWTVTGTAGDDVVQVTCNATADD